MVRQVSNLEGPVPQKVVTLFEQMLVCLGYATDPIMARSHAMLGIEIGVAIAVMAIVVAIYINLVSDGKYDKGL